MKKRNFLGATSQTCLGVRNYLGGTQRRSAIFWVVSKAHARGAARKAYCTPPTQHKPTSSHKKRCLSGRAPPAIGVSGQTSRVVQPETSVELESGHTHKPNTLRPRLPRFGPDISPVFHATGGPPPAREFPAAIPVVPLASSRLLSGVPAGSQRYRTHCRHTGQMRPIEQPGISSFPN